MKSYFLKKQKKPLAFKKLFYSKTNGFLPNKILIKNSVKIKDGVKTEKYKRIINYLSISSIFSEPRKGLAFLQKDAIKSYVTKNLGVCQISGRSKAFNKEFLISRILLREFASNKMLSGIIKSSW